MSRSTSPTLRYASTLFGIIFLGFGGWYTLSPRAAFSAFGFSPPSTLHDLTLMDNVMVMYGAKDLFMGVSIFAATWLGNRKTAGVVLMAAGGCAGVDGWVVKRATGGGEWGHWGYGLVCAMLGAVMAGVVG